MALNTHTQSSFTNHVKSYLESRFLDMIEASIETVKLGMPKSLAKREGNTVRFFRWDTPSAAGNAASLTDGVSPNGISLTTSVVNATLAQYGAFAAVSDRLQDIVINDTLKDMTDVLGYDAAVSIEALVRTELRANGTINYADDVNNSSIANVETGTDRIRSDELRIIAKNLRVANSRPFDDGFFHGVIHPLMEMDLLAESAANTFVVLSAHNGSAKEVIEKGYIGHAYGIKLHRSTLITADGTSTNTYGNVFVGKNGFGTIGISTLKPEVIIKPLGSAGTEDPLNQRATTGYKFWYAAKVLRAADVQVLWAYSV